MNFTDLKTELADRGFSDLSDARRGRYLNAARAELDRMHLWPWREKSVTGVAPFTVADLGPIEAVINTSNNTKLAKVDYQTLTDNFGDLDTTGTPSYWYTAWPAGSPVVATYPTSGDVVGVQYWAVLPDLTGSQTPPAPADAHYLIVDLAVRRVYRNTDNHQQAEAIQSEISSQIDALLFQYPPGISDGPDAYVGVGFASGDW